MMHPSILRALLTMVVLVLSFVANAQTISSIQRVTYGSPLIDSVPRNQFPRGGSYSAVIQGAGLKQVTGFLASDPQVTGSVSSASDTIVLVQISSTSVTEANAAAAPIGGVSFTLLQTPPSGQPPLAPIASGTATFDIVSGPGPQVTSWKLGSPDVKWIPGGVKTTITYLADVTSSGNVSFFYVECWICKGTSITSWTNTGDQFTTHWTIVLDMTAPTDFGTLVFPYAYGAVDGAGQGGTSGNDPLSPSPPINVPIVQMQLVDPVSSLLNGPAVTDDPTLLSTQGTVVNGVAADGVTQAVIRIAGAPPNETLSLSLAQDGGLAEIGSNNFQPSISDLPTDFSGNAFALYLAPLDFARPGGIDDAAASRIVDLNFQSSDNPGVVGDTKITIVRPPVILIHGIWDDSSTWNNFSPLFSLGASDPRFYVGRVDYSYPIGDSLSVTVPEYPANYVSRAAANALGFEFNAQQILSQIQSSVQFFKTGNNPLSLPVAGVQVDVVAHSMGGDITRTLPLQRGFLSDNTFGQGNLHKLITIDTPHLGTPLAIDLLKPENTCVRNLVAWGAGNYAFKSVTFSSGVTASGAVGDLQGDGLGGSMSVALQALNQSSPHALPTAFIAGVVNSTNLAGLTTSVVPYALLAICGGPFPFDPLAQALSPSGWPTVFGQPSDAIVPLTSQMNNLNPVNGQQIFGVVHSSGTEYLGFTGPPVTQSAAVSNTVIDLLNQPVSRLIPLNP